MDKWAIIWRSFGDESVAIEIYIQDNYLKTINFWTMLWSVMGENSWRFQLHILLN